MTDQIIKAKHIALICGGVLLIFFLFGSFKLIQPGERGILVRLGAISGDSLQEGLHLKLPILDQIRVIDIKTQKYEADASASSKDLQTIHVKIALNFRVNPSQVGLLFQNIGEDYHIRIIQPAIQESVKAATAKFTAAELISNRIQVREEIKNALESRLSSSYLQVIDFSIVNFDFSDAYEKAIEEKQVAEQRSLKAENDLKRIKIESEQRIAMAKADAESIRIQSDALKNNEALIRLKAVEKWDGKLPQYFLSKDGVLPIMSLDK